MNTKKAISMIHSTDILSTELHSKIHKNTTHKRSKNSSFQHNTALKSPPTPFEQSCYDLMRLIPKGKITTYKEIAKKLGTTAYRAIGNACNKNPYAPTVPCHRVVRSDGKLGGYAFGKKKKREILSQEGITIESGDCIDLQKFGYKFK